MLTPGTSSRNSATMLPAMTTPKNFSDRASRLQCRQGAPGRVVRIVAFLDQFGNIIEKQPGNDCRHRRNQQRQAERQSYASDNRGDQGNPARPGRKTGQQHIDPWQRHQIEQLFQPEPQRHQRKQRKTERLEENASELGA